MFGMLALCLGILRPRLISCPLFIARGNCKVGAWQNVCSLDWHRMWCAYRKEVCKKKTQGWPRFLARNCFWASCAKHGPLCFVWTLLWGLQHLRPLMWHFIILQTFKYFYITSLKCVSSIKIYIKKERKARMMYSVTRLSEREFCSHHMQLSRDIHSQYIDW